MLDGTSDKQTSGIGRCAFSIYAASVIAALTAFALGVDGLGPIDDHHFARTLFQGLEFGYYMVPELGRFFPLTAQEYVLAYKFFGPSPTLFYSLNALKLLAIGALLYAILKATRLGNPGAVVLWSVAIFSSGIANTLYRLSAGELNSLLLMLVFVGACLALSRDSRRPAIPTGVIASIALAAFSMALFYKELTFAFGLVWGFFEIIRYRRARKPIPAHIFAVLSLATLYIGGYGLWRWSSATGSYSNLHAISAGAVLEQFANNDPFIVFIIFPLAAYRLIRVARNLDSLRFQDSLIFSASAYASAFLVLRIYNTYYLLPAYAFAITGLAMQLGDIRNIFFRRGIIAFCLLCVFNQLPIYISDIQTQKTITNNHYQFVKSLARWLAENKTTDNTLKRNLVLAGVSPGSGVEIIYSLKTFLISFGVPENSIHVRGTEPSSNPRISAYYGVQETESDRIAPGDLIIYNPYQAFPTAPPLRTPSYRQILYSPKERTLPRWSGRQWLKSCVTRRPECTTHFEQAERYAGYAAFLVTRSPASVEPVPLRAPTHQLWGFVLPDQWESGSSKRFVVTLQNSGMETWPATGLLQPGRFVNLAYRWFDENNRLILQGDRAPLPEPLLPGDLADVGLTVKAPPKRGKYRLVIGPIQEDVLWFEEKGGKWINIY